MDQYRLQFDALGAIPLLDCFNPMKPEEIAAIEVRLDVRLPTAYRAFLATIGGVAFSGVVIRMIDGSPGGGPNHEETIDYLFGAACERHFGLLKEINLREGSLPADRLPIGGDLFGNLICLELGDQERVFFWDHDFGTFYQAGESFTDFVSRLKQSKS